MIYGNLPGCGGLVPSGNATGWRMWDAFEPEEDFDEDNSRLILGPIRMQRWIYSRSKQMLDRVIWAYGAKGQLRSTLSRPFNWMGPKLDSLPSARVGSSRAITQLILNLVQGTPILLIDGGQVQWLRAAFDAQ